MQLELEIQIIADMRGSPKVHSGTLWSVFGVWLSFIKSRSMNISLVLNFSAFQDSYVNVFLSDPVPFPKVSATSLLSLCPPECMELSLTRCRSQGTMADGKVLLKVSACPKQAFGFLPMPMTSSFENRILYLLIGPHNF